MKHTHAHDEITIDYQAAANGLMLARFDDGHYVTWALVSDWERAEWTRDAYADYTRFMDRLTGNYYFDGEFAERCSPEFIAAVEDLEELWEEQTNENN